MVRRLKPRGRLLKLCSLLLTCLLLLAPPAMGARSARDPSGKRLAADAVWTFTCPAPGGWASRPSVICVTVQDSDGLREDTALYRHSVDGGSTWSEWSADGLAHSSPVLTTVYLTLTLSSLDDSPSLNQVEFSILDSGGANELSGARTIPVDGTPPTVTATPDKTGTWVQPPVTITLQAYDALSGVDRTEYRLRMMMTWHPGGIIIIDGSQGDGPYTYEYRAWDRAGNVSNAQEIPVNVDGTPPNCDASVKGPVGEEPLWFTGCVTVTLNANDAWSGVAAFHYQIEGQPLITVPVTGPTATYSFSLCYECGRKTISYWASDVAANVTVPSTVTVGIDRQAPASPTSATVTPSGWSNTNVFTLCWGIPSDCSGVVAAYYKVGSPPTANNDGQLITPTLGASPCISVTLDGEGLTPVYVWLKDRGGLADYRTAISVTPRYDRTPPTCDASVKGPVGEDPLWFTGCVTVTLSGNDALSGVAAFHYQIEGEAVITVPVTGGPPTATYSFPLCYECGRKTISYWVSDLATNVQAARCSITVRIDRQAPASPTSATVTPSGGSNTNSFTICLGIPSDCSGVVAAYYKVGSPPTANNDGQLSTLPLGAPPCISGITLDREGQTLVYVWLKDRVGLADYRTAISVTLCYDRTPPVTGIIITGTMGRNNYYTSPVTVCFNASDGASGVAETRYRINGGPWQVGTCVTLNTEGTYVLEYYSVDVAGTRESPQTAPPIKLDLNAPTCTLRVDPDYLGRSFEGANVCWSGMDTPAGSGIVSYTVQYRTGACGQWQDWHPNTANTCATRTGMSANYFYYFRVRAEDRAGHVSEWSLPGKDYVYVEGLVNPSFDTCDWPLWIPTPDDVGKLTARVVEAAARTGGSSCMARLSQQWPLTGVPIDAFASFYQSVQLPPLECDRNQGLTLSFWYHIFTYDKAWSVISDNDTPRDPSDDIWGWFDTFEVHILDREGRELAEVLRDGYFGSHVPGTLYDLGWRYYNVDLTPWAGQQIRLEFKVWNRVDRFYPTWVFVDEVKLLPSLSHNHRISIPLVLNRRRVGVAPGAMPSQDAGQLVSPAESGHNGADEPPRRW